MKIKLSLLALLAIGLNILPGCSGESVDTGTPEFADEMEKLNAADDGEIDEEDPELDQL